MRKVSRVPEAAGVDLRSYLRASAYSIATLIKRLGVPYGWSSTPRSFSRLVVIAAVSDGRYTNLS